MRTCRIHFGDSLAGASNRHLRDALERLAPHCPAAGLHVHSVPELLSRLPVLPDLGGTAAVFVLLDLHRIYSLHVGAAGRELDSLLRFIADDHPFKPLPTLLAAAQQQPYRFVHDVGSLQVLRLLWRDVTPRRVGVANLLTGEVRRDRLALHPECPRPKVVGATPARLPVIGSARRGTPRPVVVDASLRSTARPRLEAMASPVAGCILPPRQVGNSASIPMALAEVVRHSSPTQLCYGKALVPSEAMLVARCESAERFQVSFSNPHDELVLGTYRDLEPVAIDPRRLFFTTAPARPGGPVYDDNLPMHWAWALDVGSQAPVLVPAQEIWFNTRRLPGEPIVINRTTNGCATGSTREEATLFALFETIERDAFLVMWYLRRPCVPIDLDRIRYEPFQLLRRRWELAFADYRLRMFDATCDTGIPVVVAFAVRTRGRGPRLFCAAAARPVAARACFTALKDLTGFRTAPSPERPGRDASTPVNGPVSHFELYRQDDSITRLAFLDLDGGGGTDPDEIDRGSIVPHADHYDLCDVIARCVAHLRGIDSAVIVKDLTHASFRRAGLHCMRVVAPGLFPMWYGAPPRFAATPRLERLGRALAGRADAAVEYNLDLHPFT